MSFLLTPRAERDLEEIRLFPREPGPLCRPRHMPARSSTLSSASGLRHARAGGRTPVLPSISRGPERDLFPRGRRGGRGDPRAAPEHGPRTAHMNGAPVRHQMLSSDLQIGDPALRPGGAPRDLALAEADDLLRRDIRSILPTSARRSSPCFSRGGRRLVAGRPERASLCRRRHSRRRPSGGLWTATRPRRGQAPIVLSDGGSARIASRIAGSWIRNDFSNQHVIKRMI